MEKYSTFIYKKNKYFHDANSSQLEIQMQCNTINFSASDYENINNLILKLIWRRKRPRIANTILKKNKTGGLVIPKLIICYQTKVIKSLWSRKRQIHQRTRRESPGIDSHKHGQVRVLDFVLSSWQRSKDNAMEKRQSFK